VKLGNKIRLISSLNVPIIRQLSNCLPLIEQSGYTLELHTPLRERGFEPLVPIEENSGPQRPLGKMQKLWIFLRDSSADLLEDLQNIGAIEPLNYLRPRRKQLLNPSFYEESNLMQLGVENNASTPADQNIYYHHIHPRWHLSQTSYGKLNPNHVLNIASVGFLNHSKGHAIGEDQAYKIYMELPDDIKDVIDFNWYCEQEAEWEMPVNWYHEEIDEPLTDAVLINSMFKIQDPLYAKLFPFPRKQLQDISFAFWQFMDEAMHRMKNGDPSKFLFFSKYCEYRYSYMQSVNPKWEEFYNNALDMHSAYPTAMGWMIKHRQDLLSPIAYGRPKSKVRIKILTKECEELKRRNKMWRQSLALPKAA
jgi:hypothetical protein